MTHETDFRAQFEIPAQPTYLLQSQIEQVRPRQCPQAEVALFDFDGTLSLIREGWPEIMVPMMVEHLEKVTDEPREALEALVRDFVFKLTGKQTIYQMMRLADEIRQRGGQPLEPLEYKDEYHQRLLEKIESRREGLRQGTTEPQAWLVPHSLELLENLRRRGVRLVLASGTDQQYVREEAALLGLDRFFGDDIYGALDDYRSFSKEAVIQRLLQEAVERPEQLIGFGDGYVEIDNLVQAGGVAIGVASDEQQRDGRIDPWKRERLISVGAHWVIGDYREHETLLGHLFGDA